MESPLLLFPFFTNLTFHVSQNVERISKEEGTKLLDKSRIDATLTKKKEKIFS